MSFRNYAGAKRFIVHADYRNNKIPEQYLVFGESKKQVRKWFAETVTWMKIYDVEAIIGDNDERTTKA